MGAESDTALLWLVRHAQPLVEEGVCYGATDLAADVADNLRAAQALAPLLPAGCTVWSSPLQRCRQLAESLQLLRPDLARCHVDPRLAEMDFGCWEGVRWNAIPRDAFDTWMGDFANHAFGGGESVRQLLQRVHGAWQDAQQTSGPLLWVTHAGVLRAAHLLCQGVVDITRSDQWPREPIAFGAHVCLPLTSSVRK